MLGILFPAGGSVAHADGVQVDGAFQADAGAVFDSVPELGTQDELMATRPAQVEAKVTALDPVRRAALQREVEEKVSEILSEEPPNLSMRAPGQNRVLATTLMGFRTGPYPLQRFISYRAANWYKQKGLEWSTNGCSVPAQAQIPLAREYSLKFNDSCVRHDFGYRNFGASSKLKLDARESMRNRIDRLLLADILVNHAKSTGDRAVAVAFYAGVDKGGRFFW